MGWLFLLICWLLNSSEGAWKAWNSPENSFFLPFSSLRANVINHTRAHFFSSFQLASASLPFSVLVGKNREDYWKRINADRSRAITLSSVRPKKDVKSRHIKNAQASLIKFKLKRQPKKFDRAVFFQREYVNAWGHKRNLFKFRLWSILRKLISSNKKAFSRFFFPSRKCLHDKISKSFLWRAN